MAEKLCVFYRMDDENKSIKEIHDDLINVALKEAFPSEFDYFSLWDETNEKESFLGKDKPEEIQRIARSWNKDLKERFRVAKENLKAKSLENGYENVEDFIFNNPWNSDVYLFIKEIQENTDEFHYGMGSLVREEEGVYTTDMDASTMDEVLNYPEEFAFVTVYYH